MPHKDDGLNRLVHYLDGHLRASEEARAYGRPRGRKFGRIPETSLLSTLDIMQPRAKAVRRATLEEAVPGYVVRVPERGSAYKVITPLQAGAEGDLLREDFAAAFASPATPVQQRFQSCCRATVLADELLFLDLETTGLGQTPLFLIGTMSWEQDNFVVRQFLARDYREEAAVLQLFLDMAAEKRLLITFNGKSFDLPMVYQRSEKHSIPCALHSHHFDLLHESRRAWRDQLPNCQLQTLEKHICGHPPRSGDIPSELIPAAYKKFMTNGNAIELAQIMSHNLRDLLTMAELLLKLPAVDGA
ncbi:MAG: ribonuclease H-like domain-containing protein [bacterium]